MSRSWTSTVASVLVFFTTAVLAVDEPKAKWLVSWAASVQGPYPVGNPSAQPDMKLAIPSAASGQLKPEFVHNTTTGGEGDRLHPNRLGYLAMGMAIDLATLKIPRAK